MLDRVDDFDHYKVLHIVAELVRRCRVAWEAGFEEGGRPSSGTVPRRFDLDPLFGDLHF